MPFPINCRDQIIKIQHKVNKTYWEKNHVTDFFNVLVKLNKTILLDLTFVKLSWHIYIWFLLIKYIKTCSCHCEIYFTFMFSQFSLKGLNTMNKGQASRTELNKGNIWIDLWWGYFVSKYFLVSSPIKADGRLYLQRTGILWVKYVTMNQMLFLL